MLEKQRKRIKRHRKIRGKLKGTGKIPRLCVFRSAKHIYAQLVDDEKSVILVSACDKEFKKSSQEKTGKTGKADKSFEVGKLIAKKSADKKINKIIFDRGGYKYHGRIKSLADGAREGGLKF